MHINNPEFELSIQGLQKLSGEATEQSQLVLEILNTLSDRVFIKNTSGQVTFVNRAFLNDYGYSPDDLIGKQCEDYLPPEMVTLCKEADREVFEKDTSISLEINWRDDSGTSRCSETHKSPLRNQQGETIGLVGISRDVTARRKAEEGLNRQKKLLELIIETVPDEIFVKDRDRNIILANKSFYSGCGLDPNTTVGSDPSVGFKEGLRQLSVESDNAVLLDGKTICTESTKICRKRGKRHFEVRKLPLCENGSITGVVAVCRDLTDSVEAEQNLKRNESLLFHASRLSTVGELSAQIAHEVNQPLFSILNYAKAVENRLENEDDLDLDAIRKWVRQIRNEAARGGKITQRLKSFVKPADTQLKETDLPQLITESAEFMDREARDAGISIEVISEHDLPAVNIDRIQIQQVLVNLLKNSLEAISAAETESPRIRICANRTSHGVHVKVEDNGPGISPDLDKAILQPFHTTKHDGLGLGLAISKTVIETHNGQLNYYPNDWGGVTFFFTLPFATK